MSGSQLQIKGQVCFAHSQSLPYVTVIRFNDQPTESRCHWVDFKLQFPPVETIIAFLLKRKPAGRINGTPFHGVSLESSRSRHHYQP